jgi:hypothetical protein
VFVNDVGEFLLHEQYLACKSQMATENLQVFADYFGRVEVKSP